jgi:hypothetical protein
MRALALLALCWLPACGCGGQGSGSTDAGMGGGTGLGGIWPLCLLTRTCVPDAGMPRCNPSTCAGCCDERGSCQSGTTAFVCGVGGSACIACPQGFTCELGRCRPIQVTCDVSNCSGCCALDGRCVSGTDLNACGQGGTPCASCGSARVCSGAQCITRCDGSNCSGCCDANGLCWSGFTEDACGRGGSACTVCPANLRCNSQGFCDERPCSGCRQGQCCLGGQCVDTSAQRCAVAGLPNAACRICGGGEACGEGTEFGFCVRPGTRPLGDPCVWDGDCAVGASGRPACLTGLSWPQGYCSDVCDAGTCGPGAVCQRWPRLDVCLKACPTPGLACANALTVCDVVDAGLTACVPKCTASNASVLCASGRCHADGRCCGAPGRVCCDTGQACLGTGRDGGASVCLADGTCS